MDKQHNTAGLEKETTLTSTRLNHCIRKIGEIVTQYRLTPPQYRYVTKRIREELDLQIPKTAKNLPEYLTPAEIYHVLSIANTPYNGLLVEFLIFTGLRISEARNLLIGHLDIPGNQLKVVAGKGQKDRYVPLTSNLGHKIRLWLGNRSVGYVFGRQNGRRYSVRSMQRRVSGVLDMAGLDKKLHTHSLRHTFACLCMARGIPIERIQLMMGHSSVKTTEIYAKMELGAVKEQFLALMDKRG